MFVSFFALPNTNKPDDRAPSSYHHNNNYNNEKNIKNV